MKLIDLDQTIVVPVCDETQDGVEYEMEMTIAELFERFMNGFEPEIVDAIPVEWMASWINRHPNDLRCAWFASLEMEWQKEQEARST